MKRNDLPDVGASPASTASGRRIGVTVRAPLKRHAVINKEHQIPLIHWAFQSIFPHRL